MIDYYLGGGLSSPSRVEKGILTQELIQRIQKEIENDSDFVVCSNKHALIMH